MAEGNKDSVTNTPVVTTLTAEVAKPNATVNAQEAITNAQVTKIVTPEQFAEAEKRNSELEKQVKQLLEDKKLNTLNNLLINVKDQKVKEEFVKKWSKNDNIDQLKEFLTEVYPILRASEQEEEPKEGEGGEGDGSKQKTGAKSKGASLPAEPVIPKEETESKTASIPVNKLQEILRFQRSGGRA